MQRLNGRRLIYSARTSLPDKYDVDVGVADTETFRQIICEEIE